MPELIPTINEPLSSLPRVQVWTAPRLYPPEWTEQPWLWPLSLTRSAAPQIDQAQFEWNYGLIQQHGTNAFSLFVPLSLEGHYVRVEISDRATGALLVRWYGVIEEERNEAAGLSKSDGVSRGRQTFTAYGLLRLLERVFIRSANKFADAGETGRITIEHGIPFNVRDAGEYAETGNRSLSTSGGTFVFSDAPELSAEWSAYTAAEYLLANHPPVDGDDALIATWLLQGDPAILGWYDVHVRTEGRSVKDILDELIPRKRAVGYWVDYDPELNTVYLKLFSLNGFPLILPSGIIPANPDQRSLDFERAISISRAVLRNVVTSRYHEVVARGERKTSTCTLRFESQRNEFVPAWSDDQKQEFLDGASNEAGYAALSLIEKTQRNAALRAAEGLYPVFRRFVISGDWSQRQPHHFALAGEEDPREWWVAPVLADTGFPAFDGVFLPGQNAVGEPIWKNNLSLNRYLALRQGLDYSGDRIETEEFLSEPSGPQAPDTTQHLRPLFFAHLQNLQNFERYVRIENLGLMAAWESDNRRWSAEAEILPKGPFVDLTVIGGPQSMWALSAWATAAETDPEHDPEKQGGLDYSELWGTITIPIDRHVEESFLISFPPPGQQKRVLTIDVPEARLDYVVPWTVVALTDGTPVQTQTGGFVRDDRGRLFQVAQSAAEWYGKVRQTLDVAFRKISPVVELGALIVDVPSLFQREDVNTVVTRISYDLSNPRQVTTEFETTFAEFDLF